MSTAQRRTHARTLAPMLALLGLTGCTLVQMKQHNAQQEADITAKQAELGSLQQTNSALATQTSQLKSDLQQRQLNASELHARLDELLRLNASAQAGSDAEKTHQAERQRQLQAVSTQAHALEQNTGLSDAQKRQRLAELQKETARVLDELLQS